ncbi:hypothetical protein ACH5RR_026267 [Cinchona calisaya]|uniref:CCHC-type domain-containing protein n=1 Tax=Cinchona calisaya TaxID=153742 RepID=A0ABD2Z5E4_9GENT
MVCRYCEFLVKEVSPWYADIVKKENIVEMKRNLNLSINKNFTTFRKDDLCFVKSKSSLYGNKSIICNNCQQHGHVKKNCYVKRNENLGMKSMWILSQFTNSYGSKKI